jgi:ferredoxin
MEDMRVEVDRSRCFGSGGCIDLLPEVFELNAEGVSVVINIDLNPDLLNVLKEAEADCPSQAISMVMDS